MKITQEVRAFAIDQAGRRCECTRANCRHHLSGARCKRGLRGDGWKVYWRKESGGATRENIEAWCLECFDNNFEAPRETVALLAAEIFGYSRLLEEDERRALTLKSVLRDSAERAAKECRGRVVLDRFDDDLLLEFATSQDAVKAARRLYAGFEEIARRLELPVPDICGAIHEGEVTRWRNGFLAGDTVEIATGVRSAAGVGQVLLTEAAAAPVRGKVELEPVVQNPEMPPPATEDPGKPQRGLGEMWAIRL